MLHEGQLAPEFSLADQNGTLHSLSEYAGTWVLLYFYPKDETPGCTTEACAIRDAYTDFQDAGIAVLGISGDSVESHKKFAEHHRLPFTLLADEDRSVTTAYGAKGMLMNKRISYVIDPSGSIAKVYPDVKPEEHAREVLDFAKNFRNA